MTSTAYYICNSMKYSLKVSMQYIIFKYMTHKSKALFNTNTSINALSFKFFSHIQQHIKLLPTSRKVVSADGNSLGPISEVHLKFKVGKIDFNDVFVILNSLQRNIILRLPWQCNYRISCSCGTERVSISSPLKINF